MSRRLALTTLTAFALLAPAAAAAPGAVDRSFGGGDGLVELRGAAGARDVTPIPGDRIVSAAPGSTNGFLTVTSPSGRSDVVLTGITSTLLEVLPDGRFVTAQSGTVTRRLRTGRLARSFGSGRGRVPVPVGWSVAAVGHDGRLALLSDTGGPDRLRVIDPGGALDARFGERELVPPLNDSASSGRRIAFDGSGRVVVATEVGLYETVLQRFTAAGPEDAGFGRPRVPILARRLVVDRAGHVVVLDDRPGGLVPVLVAADGRTVPWTRAVLEAVFAVQAIGFDRQGRVITTDGSSLRRLSADGQRFELLRRTLPGSERRRVQSIAVDRQGRIVLGGYRLVGAGGDPDGCGRSVCREDLAATEGFLMRIEGGTRRVALVTGFRTTKVTCLSTARTRCIGSLTLKAPGRPAIRRRVRLSPRGSASYRVPRALRRARIVVADARIHDGTGELSTARALLLR